MSISLYVDACQTVLAEITEGLAPNLDFASLHVCGFGEMTAELGGCGEATDGLALALVTMQRSKYDRYGAALASAVQRAFRDAYVTACDRTLAAIAAGRATGVFWH
jgi:hypothetical protein